MQSDVMRVQAGGDPSPAPLARLWRGFWQLADPKVWIASVVPMSVGTALAFRAAGAIHWGWLAATVAGVFLLEIGKNGINEAVDFLSGADIAVAADKRNPFSGGKKTIVDGRLTLREVQWIAWSATALGTLLGLAIAAWREPGILWIGVAGVFFAIFYSQPPLKLVYRGFGEVAVGVAFGPLLTLGAYLVQAGQWHPTAAAWGVPFGFLIANILWINEFPDVEADRAAGKLTGVARLGRRRAVPVYALLYLGAYVSIILLAVSERNWACLLGLLSLPVAIRSVLHARRYADDISRLLAANARTVLVYVITGVGTTIGLLLA